MRRFHSIYCTKLGYITTLRRRFIQVNEFNRNEKGTFIDVLTLLMKELGNVRILLALYSDLLGNFSFFLVITEINRIYILAANSDIYPKYEMSIYWKLFHFAQNMVLCLSLDVINQSWNKTEKSLGVANLFVFNKFELNISFFVFCFENDFILMRNPFIS